MAAAPPSTVPGGAQAYEVIPATDANAPRGSYVIVPSDVLNLQVYDEPGLSNDSLQVDASGNIQLPLIGEVAAADRSPTAVAKEIESRLRERYIVNPQVVLSVKKPAPRYVAVEGQVNKPGVYEIDGKATLLSAVARAESPTRVARLTDVIVFRNAAGKHMAARFNLLDVRAGRAPDPQIVGGDVVVVGFSQGKAAWRDFLQAAPLFNLFYIFR